MNIHIIEDDPNKLIQIKEFVQNRFADCILSNSGSYNHGLRSIINDNPDLVLLDMSLPTYNITQNESGGRPRSFGGRDILYEMKRKGVKTKAIIVTQFEDFRDEREAKNLNELKKQLNKEFPENYIGTVYYQSSGVEWQNELKHYIAEFIKNIGD